MKKLIFLLSLCIPAVLFAQHHGLSSDTASHRHFHFSLVLGHTYLTESTVTGDEIIVLPSIGLDLEYWHNDRFGIGLHNDMELFTFEILDAENIYIERRYPVLVTADFLWKPVRNLSLFTGPGIELERERNFAVYRLGIEYDGEVTCSISFSPIIFYDIRFNAYNSFSMGIGISYHN